MSTIIKFILNLSYVLTIIVIFISGAMLIYAGGSWFIDVYFWPYLNFIGLRRNWGLFHQPYLERIYSIAELDTLLERGVVRDHKGWSRAEMAWWWDTVHTVIDQDLSPIAGSKEARYLEALKKNRTWVYWEYDAKVVADRNILIRKNYMICRNLFFRFLSPLGHLFNYFCDYVFNLHTLTPWFRFIEEEIKHPYIRHGQPLALGSYIIPFGVLFNMGWGILVIPYPDKWSLKLKYLIWFTVYLLSACAVFFIYLGCLRRDLLSLIKIIFKNGLCGFSEIFYNRIRLYYIFINKNSLRGFLAFLKYNSFTYGSIIGDITGFERVRHKNQLLLLNSVIIIYLPWWGLKICIIAISGDWGRISNISEFFAGSTWPEREASEMFGLTFINKWDARRLMVDYSFEGSPLLKQFPVIGYEELEYDYLDKWLFYRGLKMQSGININTL